MPNNEEDIKLSDYIKVIIKKKWLVLGITLGAIAIAVILSLTAPKAYEASTILEIGSMKEAKTGTIIAIEPPAQLIEKIKNGNYDEVLSEKLNLNIEDIPLLEAENPANTNLLIVSALAQKPEKAKHILEELNKIILADHQEKLDKKRAELEKNIKESQEKLALLETKKQGSEGIAELQIEISNLKDQLSALQATKVSKDPLSSTAPKSPGLTLNSIIGLVLGFFVGVVVAFIKNWWEKENATS